MPDMIPDDALRSLVENIDLWAEHVLGHKDFDRRAAAEFHTTDPHTAALLDTFYKIHCSFRSGTVCDVTWSGVRRALRTLMSTAWFRSHWELRQAEFPEEFRALMREMCA
jgi:hypothetical protein